MEAEKLKHLEFIQNTITRMNINSFLIKGWAITVVSATLAIYAATKNCYFALIGIFPTLLFWFLDANYLTQERRFRRLYNDVAGISENPIEITPFSMDIESYIEGKCYYWSAFWSSTIRNLYLFIIVMLIVLLTYLKLR